MARDTWTQEQMAAYAAAHGLTRTTTEEMQHMAALATRVARVAAAIPRMPSKECEPASSFKVPQ